MFTIYIYNKKRGLNQSYMGQIVSTLIYCKKNSITLLLIK